jgi:hypothetical protein
LDTIITLASLLVVALAFLGVRRTNNAHPPENGTWDSGRWDGSTPEDTWDAPEAKDTK